MAENAGEPACWSAEEVAGQAQTGGEWNLAITSEGNGIWIWAFGINRQLLSCSIKWYKDFGRYTDFVESYDQISASKSIFAYCLLF